MGLLKKTDYNAKISEIKGKIPSIAGPATTGALDAVKNKIPNVNNLVKKSHYNLNILPHLSIINLWVKYLMQR